VFVVEINRFYSEEILFTGGRWQKVMKNGKRWGCSSGENLWLFIDYNELAM